MRQDIERRSFLKGTAGGALASAAGRAERRPAPSDRVVIGLIGAGVRGRDHHLRFLAANPRVEIAAVCDVDRQRADFAAQVAARARRKAPLVFGDFRELLARKEIDAVVISTPDHWHSIIAIQAMEAGKDVYCEKPLTLFIAEGRRMVDVARQYGTVFQTGSQQRSDWRFRQAVALVRSGRIGRLKRIITHLGNPGTTSGAFIHPGVWQPAQTPPEGLDFDMWLGPAPYHDYSPNRCHFEFRYNLDHSGGRITDWGAHHNGIAQWALGMDRSGPVRIEGKGGFNKAGPYDYANYLEVRYHYPDGVELLCENEGGNGVRFEGADGWIFVTRLRLDASRPEILAEPAAGTGDRAYDDRNRNEEIPGTDEHHNNWLDSIRTRKPCVADIETGHRSATVCHLGNIAMRLGRPLQWDPEKEEFLGDAAANMMRDKPFRAPWRL
ncbi:MAG: Gfo/Idh/MocA family protein [Bryobacteraceae bacterium]